MSLCVVCGHNEFEVIDGFYYCKVCSTQSQVHREVERDAEAIFLGNKSICKLKKPTTSREIISEKNEKKHVDVNPEISTGQCSIDYPIFLNRIGLRLSTFTKLLAHYSDILVHQYNVPSSLKTHTYNILQLYLKHFKIAFCEEELDDKDPFCPIVKNENYNAEMKERRVSMKKRNELALTTSKNIFEHIVNACDVDLTSSVIDEEIRKVTQEVTKLSKAAVKNALLVPMTIEIIIAILFLGSLCSGAKWILLSDLTRWFREGRLLISQHQRCALLATSGSHTDEMHSRKSNGFSSSTPLSSNQIYPLFEHFRTVLAIAQLTSIPSHPVMHDFKQILSRLCFNLNLPSAFMTQIHAVYSFFPPRESFDIAYSRCFGDFDSSKMLSKSVSILHDYINYGFEEQSYKSFYSSRSYSVLPTPEAKAIAIILFTLKLMFGLDDKREIRQSSGNSNDEAFNFANWIHQLRMRMQAWQGRTVKDVLMKKTRAIPCYDLVHEDSRTFVKVRSKNAVKDKQVWVPTISSNKCIRDKCFNDCVPHYIAQEQKEYALFHVFSDDVEPRPLASIFPEAVFTPLRLQATINEEWYNNLRQEYHRNGSNQNTFEYDMYNSKVFFKTFDNCTMDFEMIEENSNEEATLQQTQRKDRTLIEKLFPSVHQYIAYPRPQYCANLMKSVDSELYVPLIYTRAMDVIYSTAQMHFSESFSFLLKSFSLIIGEKISIVYALFLMLEIAFIEPERLKLLHEIVEKKEEFEIEVLTTFLPRDKGFIRLRHVDREIDRANYAFQILDICKQSKFQVVNMGEKEDDGDSLSNRKRKFSTNTFSKYYHRCKKFDFCTRILLDFDVAYALTISKYW